MRVPLSLLLSFCDPGLPVEEIASVLALTGTEVERITRLGVEGEENFVVGEVIAVDPHPDADRLRVCTVDVGDGTPRTIVCGAANVAPGQLVPVALVGAVVKGGLKIKKSKLRGVASEGMICSADELDLATGSEGILVLGEGDGPVGRALSEVLVLSETVLELEVTPNRPDCLGVWGVARELHAATGAPLAAAPWEAAIGTHGELDGVTVTVEPDVGCARFTATIHEGISPDARTPQAARAHLHAAGMRSISPIVDITNYVMLVTGEPMHAFDLDLVEGGRLDVRSAVAGEEVETLDGNKRVLAEEDVLISDGSGPTSIAGLMGGARSEVSPTTTRVLLEAAVWDGPRLNRTSARLGLRSEASTRFEKGLSPVLPGRAQAFASVLFGDWCQSSQRPGMLDIQAGEEVVERIGLELSSVEGLLGIGVSKEEATDILVALGCEVEGADGLLGVIPPADRLDLVRPVDLIEEIARIKGLDKVDSTLPTSRKGAGALTRSQKVQRRLSDAMAAAGAFEIAGWSFASPAVLDSLLLPRGDERRRVVSLENPMSEEESTLRTTLLTSLLDALALNVAHGSSNIKLFEVGTVYMESDGGEVIEPRKAASVMCGSVRQPTWLEQEPPAFDFHAAVGVLGFVLDSLRVEWDVRPPSAPQPFLHPGRSGEVVVNKDACGWIGELHPQVSRKWGIPAATAWEIDLAALTASSAEIPMFKAYSSHPAVVQDLAVVVDATAASSEVLKIARDAGGAELESATLFDVYESDEIGAGKVSLAVRLVFRADDRTLTEDEATTSRAAILSRLEQEIGATARV